MSQDPPNSSAENLLNNSDTLSNSVDNSYMNPVGPDSIPGSPPPTYQHVLDESQTTSERTPTRSHIRRTSYDSISQCSNAEQSPTRSSLIRRANTISTDDSSLRYEESDEYADRTVYEDYEKEIEGSEADLLSNVAGSSEMSLWPDFQEPSTSYDASSRQLDNDSITASTISQIGDRDSDRDTSSYKTIKNVDDNVSNRNYARIPRKPPVKNQRIIKVANKTSKAMYAALAKELGLQCRMSDQCPCADCQGGYLMCGDGEGDTTDGGLGAGTPMFVAEAFGHGVGPACQII